MLTKNLQLPFLTARFSKFCGREFIKCYMWCTACRVMVLKCPKIRLFDCIVEKIMTISCKLSIDNTFIDMLYLYYKTNFILTEREKI